MTNYLSWDGNEAAEKRESWEVVTWIPVEKALPEEGRVVLAWSHSLVSLAWVRHDMWLNQNGRLYLVTHWATFEGP